MICTCTHKNCYFIFHVKGSQVPDRCPDCGKVHEVFGPSKAAEMAAAHGIKAVASVPIDPALAAAVDAGTVELADVSFMKSILDALV